LDEEVASYYWSSQAPVRLMFFFAVTAYSYVYKPDGIMGPKGMDTGVGDLVCNSMVFTWGFVEVMAWFWVSGMFGFVFFGESEGLTIA